MTIQQPIDAVRSLPTGTVTDQIFAPDGKTLYTVRNGTVTAHDVASGSVTNSWTIGTRLGGIDISADGRSIVAVELAPGTSGGTWPNITTHYSLYSLDTVTGQAKTYDLPVTTSYPEGYADPSFLPDGKVLIAGGGQWQPLTVLDLATGARTTTSQTFQGATLTASADHSRTLVSPLNISDAPLFIYTAGTGITASHQSYADNISGYNNGVQAISPDGKLSVEGVSLAIYDSNLRLVTKLVDRYPLGASGLAFSPDGSKLYLLDPRANEVFVLSTSSWDVLGGYPVDTAVAIDSYGNSPTTRYGNALIVSADGKTLAVGASTSVQLIDLTKAVSDAGTSAGNDVLTGNSSPNILYGFEGNDTLDGAGGMDTLYGGQGDDSYYVDNVGDIVTERPGQGNDTVYSSVSYTSPSYVETLVLTGTGAINAYGTSAAETLIGNDAANILLGGAGDDILVGNGGNDTLDGGTGNDRMTGGAGDDTYYLDTLADTVVEAAGAGNDLVYAGFSYTLPTNVERLVLTGIAGIAGTGNDLTNQIVGNGGDNVLSGLAGDDILTGNQGNDRIDGGAGVDTAVFGSTMAPTSVGFAANGSVVVTGADGRDTLLGIETLQFANGTLDVAAAAPVGNLYASWAGRDANAAELAYWTGRLASGAVTLAGIKAAILADPLGQNNTNTVVTGLYQTYGGRAAGADELAVWRGQIANGATFDTVRQAILADPIGTTAKAVIGLYTDYMGRAPGDNELRGWQAEIRAGTSLAAVRTAILDDAGGRAHTVSAVTDLYGTYGGRAPSAGELQVWQANVRAGATFADVKTAIVADPLGTVHVNNVVNGFYQTYGGRAASTGELQVWHDTVLAGASLGDVRAAILADPLGQNHTNAVVTELYRSEFGHAPSTGELAAWQGLVRGGATFDTLLDTLIADRGSDATGTQRLTGTAAADALVAGSGHDTAITGFDPLRDGLTLARGDVASGNPLDAAHARQIFALDGNPDVLLTLDDGHHVLLQHVSLTDLSAGNIHLV